MTFARFAGLCLCVACASAPLTKAPAPSRAAPSQPSAVAEPREVVDVPNAREPIPGVTTGGKPTEVQLQQAKDLGYHSVISLLPDADAPGEAEAVRGLGLTFVSIPVADVSALTEDNARRLAAAMDAPDAKPLLLHCGTGNRAGALLALKAFYVDSATPADALELGTRAGLTSLRPQVEAKMQEAAR